MTCTYFPSTGLIPNVTTHTVGNIIYFWTGVVWESQANIPVGELINDLSIPYIFDTVADYKASTIVFPVGKTVHLLDRGADFTVIAGTGTATGYKIIASTSVNQSIDLIASKSHNLNQYGAGNGIVAEDNIAIQEAITHSGDGGYITCNGGSSFETDIPIEGIGSRVSDLLNATWKYSGIGGTVLRLQPNSKSDFTMVVPLTVTALQSSFNPIPSELSGAAVGDVIALYSDDVNLPSGDGDYLKGQVVKVTKIEGGTLQFYPNLVDDFTIHRVTIFGKTEGTSIKNVKWDCVDNGSNNSILDIIYHSSVDIDNANIAGSGFQNIGLSVKGVDIDISNCSIIGVANDNNAPGYGIAVAGTNITVTGGGGTKCRHLVDGGSRAFYTVGLSYDGITASKGDGASDNNYILGFHASCRGFSMKACNLSGSGNLASVRGGHGKIIGNDFLGLSSTIYASILVGEEGAKNLIIDDNGFDNAEGVSGLTCVRLTTLQENTGCTISNSRVSGDKQVLCEVRNNGFDTKGLVLNDNKGNISKLLNTTTSVSAPPAKSLQVTMRDNDCDSKANVVGYYVSFIENFVDLDITLIDNDMGVNTSAGMFGITGDISGNLTLNIAGNKTTGEDQSYFISPNSLTGNFELTFKDNDFPQQFVLGTGIGTAGSYGKLLIKSNEMHRPTDPMNIIPVDLPIIIQGNTTSDSQGWRLVRTLYPEAMIGNFNLSTGYVTANGYKDYGVWNFADGSWRSNTDPGTLPLDFKGIEFMRRRNYAIGSPTGYAFDGTNWVPLVTLV